MISQKTTPENFSSSFSQEEREKISQAVNLIFEIADEAIIICGKKYENEQGEMKSKTTAAIFCTSKYKLSVAEKLIAEVKSELE